jgi:K+-sensing histidine kinase KdpD
MRTLSGLRLSYGIVKAHRGEINEEMKEVEGTIFIILLSAKENL